MSRTKSAVIMRKLNTSLPEALLAQVDLLLFSEVEGRVPYGAYGKLLEGLLRRWLDEHKDLSKLD